MSAPHFDMNAVWNDQQVAPQLEEEYGSPDPTSFTLQQNGMGSSAARRQPMPSSSHSSGFQQFNPSFPPNGGQPFNFTVQPPQAPGMNGSQSFFPPAGSSGTTQQHMRHQSFPSQSTIFASPSGSPNMGFQQDASMFSQYPQTQSTYDVGAGSPHNNSFNSASMAYTPTFHPVGLPTSQRFQDINPGVDFHGGEPSLKRLRQSDIGFPSDELVVEEKESTPSKTDPASKRP